MLNAKSESQVQRRVFKQTRPKKVAETFKLVLNFSGSHELIANNFVFNVTSVQKSFDDINVGDEFLRLTEHFFTAESDAKATL